MVCNKVTNGLSLFAVFKMRFIPHLFRFMAVTIPFLIMSQFTIETRLFDVNYLFTIYLLKMQISLEQLRWRGRLSIHYQVLSHNFKKFSEIIKFWEIFREARYIHFHKYYRHQIALPDSIDLGLFAVSNHW